MGEKRLNLQGEVCPVPLMIIQEELAKMNIGDILLVDTDMGQTVRNILWWCEKNQYAAILDETDNGVWVITITR